MANIKGKLTEGKPGKIILMMTIPQIFGLVGMVIFNLVDTFFVGKLGIPQLAALGFTFPVISVVNSVALGLGTGASALISRAIGEGNHDKAARITTGAVTLAFLIAIVITVFGEILIGPLFTLLGADADVMPFIKEYMRIWYLGFAFVSIPMVANNAMRATGDTITPTVVMLSGAVLNVILDPILIFGWGNIPAMGVKGAAIATVAARAMSMTVSVILLKYKKDLLTFKRFSIKEMLFIWGKVLKLGIPAVGAQAVTPFAVAVLTSMLAVYGNNVIAGYAVASRVEFFVLSVLMSQAVVMNPFVGQNIGAGRFDRVRQGLAYSGKFSLIYSLSVLVLIEIFAKHIAAAFNQDPAVIEVVVRYLRIVPFAYAAQGIVMAVNQALNAMHRPIHSMLMSVAQMFVFCIPLAYIGSAFWGETGIFVALGLAYLIVGVAAIPISKRVLAQVEEEQSALRADKLTA